MTLRCTVAPLELIELADRGVDRGTARCARWGRGLFAI